MRVVAALGGNALLRRGEPMTAEAQRRNARVAATALAPLAEAHNLVITHGNGPQVGLLALQGAAYRPEEAYPLDVLGAETEGMIGYMIEQELGNLLPSETPLATIMTMVEVDPEDPAFDNPTKFIGPGYERTQAARLAQEKGWTIGQDGDKWRRVVPSPQPRRIFELRPIKWLQDKGCVVICAGGGGVPTLYGDGGRLQGVEAVIDKDWASALLARDLEADALLLLTDVPAVLENWGMSDQREIGRATPRALKQMSFAAGSMGPKVEAACDFVERTGKITGIGRLADATAILEGRAGTYITPEADGVEPGQVRRPLV
jgi:carbamate kinase